ncbi:MAG: hypothetical protein K2W94_08480 [Alphaproteobacteria bacterium]|nr:hypothetical protein [Alphaproteobacteria bacterium]
MKNYKIVFLLLCVLIANTKILNAAEFSDLDYSYALSSNDMAYKYRTFYRITLNEKHSNRSDAAAQIVKNYRRDVGHDHEKAYIEKACEVLRDTAANHQNPLSQLFAATVLYEIYYCNSDAELQSLNTGPIRRIVNDDDHKEQCRAALTILEKNKIFLGLNGEEDQKLALTNLIKITQTRGRNSQFKAAIGLWDKWNFGLKEEDRYLTQHFISAFFDVVQTLNNDNENLFEAASKLLQLYQHGENVNEEHKVSALEALRYVARNSNDVVKQDNAAMFLGWTLKCPEYNRADEDELDLDEDLSLVKLVLFKSARDEKNPNQLKVLTWLYHYGPEERRATFYGILKKLANKDTKEITDGHLVQKIRKAAELLHEIDASKTN